MDEIVEILYILKSLAVNYPIIKDLDYRFTRIPLVLVGQGQTRNLMKLLNFYGYVNIYNYPTDSAKAQKRILEGAESLVFFCCCSEHQKNDLLDWLGPIYASECLEGKKIKGLPIVVSEISYIEDTNNQFFIISLQDEDISSIEIELDEVRPRDSLITNIIETQGYIKNLNADNDVKILCSAASFLPKNKNDVELLYREISFVERLFRYDEEYHDFNGVHHQFLSELGKWQNSVVNPIICELPNVDSYVLNRFKETVFYTEDYVFLSEELFKLISERLFNTIKINALKFALVKEKILSIDECCIRSYTVKMYYYTEMGEFCSKRMYRFYRNRLTPPGELDFIDNFGFV